MQFNTKIAGTVQFYKLGFHRQLKNPLLSFRKVLEIFWFSASPDIANISVKFQCSSKSISRLLFRNNRPWIPNNIFFYICIETKRFSIKAGNGVFPSSFMVHISIAHPANFIIMATGQCKLNVLSLHPVVLSVVSSESRFFLLLCVQCA